MSHIPSDHIARRLREAREAYYDSDTPLMSDAEYDALEDELRRLDPKHNYFSTLGHLDPDSAGGKIGHRVPMLSMGKAKDLDEAEKWLRRLDPESGWSVAVQPKIDGLSASLHYEGGTLLYVATRGDGKQGQDISRIAPYLPDIPPRIAFTREPVEIRGELHLPKNTEYGHRRPPLEKQLRRTDQQKGRPGRSSPCPLSGLPDRLARLGSYLLRRNCRAPKRSRERAPARLGVR